MVRAERRECQGRAWPVGGAAAYAGGLAAVRSRVLGLVPTLIWLALAAALTVLFGWRGARLPDPRRGPRMLPYRFLMLVSAAGALLLLVHLVNLAGVPTGRP